MRAVSTVLDVSLCLLLVSASAVTLAGTPAPGGRDALEASPATGPDTADEVATLLATSTARVSYRLPGAAAASARNRTVHDTLAGLLASAVTAAAESTAAEAGPGPVTSGQREPRTADAGTSSATPFVRAVAARVERALRRGDVTAQVVARRPASGRESKASGATEVVAGPEPPPDADVYAAAFGVRGVRLTVRTWSG